MRNTFDDLRFRNKTLRLCSYDFITCSNKQYVTQNTFPDVIILEGSFALNLFNDEVYNVEDYDCMKPADQKIKKEYIKNPYDFSEDFHILKYLFIIDLDDHFEIYFKKCTEKKFFDLSNPKTKQKFTESLKDEFYKKSLPAFNRWINNLFLPNYIVSNVHRTSNNRAIIVKDIFTWLNLLNISPCNNKQ